MDSPITTNQPRTLTEAVRNYADPQTCINAVAAMRWEDGSPVCPHCNAAQGYALSPDVIATFRSQVSLFWAVWM